MHAVCRLISILLLASVSTAALAQLEEPVDELEEIVVVGTPPDHVGFPTIGGWFSFAVTGFGSSPISLWQALEQFNDLADKASEQVCQNKIEQWRQQCHSTYADYQPVCMLSGLYSGGSLVSSFIPAIFRTAGGMASGTATAMGCMSLTQRAHTWCDNVADSEAAPDIAECD